MRQEGALEGGNEQRVQRRNPPIIRRLQSRVGYHWLAAFVQGNLQLACLTAAIEVESRPPEGLTTGGGRPLVSLPADGLAKQRLEQSFRLCGRQVAAAQLDIAETFDGEPIWEGSWPRHGLLARLAPDHSPLDRLGEAAGGRF